MNRRTLLAAGLVVPVELLARVDTGLALAAPTDRPATVEQVRRRVAAAQSMFSADQHAQLLDDMPGLLGDAHALVDADGSQQALAAAASAYDIATETMIKVGRVSSARVTAQRSLAYACEAQQPVARAVADRNLSVVLRHEGRPDLAQQVTVEGAARLDATGLTSRDAMLAFTRMMATAAYNAAVAGNRSDALTLIDEAERAAALLPRNATGGQMSVAGVRLYRSSIHWALGDSGTAIDIAERLHPAMFSTAERRGRLHTDTAHAWWQRARPDETATALLDALAVAPGEVRHRPTIRAIATELVQRHHHLSAVQDLSSALAAPARNA